MKSFMRAMVLEAPRSPLRCREIPRPEPADGELLVKVYACGVCRTELHVLDGELPDPKLPLVPGHQVVGRVVAGGPGAERLSCGHESIGPPSPSYPSRGATALRAACRGLPGVRLGHGRQYA